MPSTEPLLRVHLVDVELRAALAEAGLSRAQAARLIGVPEGTLATLLWGSRGLGPRTRARLASWPGDGPAARALRERCA